MATKSIPLSGVFSINLNCKKKLVLKSWDSEDLQIEVADEHELEIQQSDECWEIRTEEDCVIHAPSQAQLKVSEVGGSASIMGGFAALELTNIGGSLMMEKSTGLTAHNIGGSCKLSGCSGDFVFQNIGGHLKAVDMAGTVSVMNVGGHIKVDGLVAKGRLLAGGSIKARLVENVQDLDITAGGHIKLSYPQGCGFYVQAISGANRIILRNADGDKTLSGGSVKTTVGEGGATLNLRAGGSVVLMEAGKEGEDFSEEIQLKSDWVNDMEPRIREQINQKMERIQRRAEQRARDAEKRVKDAMGRLDFNKSINIPEIVIPSFSIPDITIGKGWSGEGNAEPETRPQVTDEERMLVLQMLKDKQITAEEADRLLDALEGKFGES